jgi:hypothetical protein
MSDDDTRSDNQREWADWSAGGYRKFNQPRSVLRIAALGSVLLIAWVLALLWVLSR